MIAQQDSRRLDAVLLRDLDHGLGREQRAARAPQRAVRHDVDALLLAEVDDLLLGERRVVLDLVDGGDHGGVGEELLEVALAVLFLFGLFKYTSSWLGVGERESGRGGRTLDTPMPLALLVWRTCSICFHVSTWLWERMMSRSPLGSLGKRSSFPREEGGQELAAGNGRQGGTYR